MDNIWTALSLVVIGSLLLWWYFYWNYHGRKLQKKDGYIPPAPGFRATKAMAFTSYIGRFILSGPCTIVGRENIDRVKNQRVIFLPAHVDEADWSVVFPELRRPTRYMASRDQLAGIRKRMAAFTGALAVNNKTKKSRAEALEASIQAMVKDGERAAFTIFMQGGLIRNNVISIDDFKMGAVRIAKAVVERTNDTSLAGIPMAVAYVQDESAGGLRRQFNNWTVKIRSGNLVHNVAAVLVIGEPIAMASLPTDDEEAKAFLVAAIEKCSNQAKEIAAKQLEERKTKKS
jgi:hypothetical protein